MTIEAIVSDDGTLVVKVPERYKGKTVRITIQDTELEPADQWTELSQILREAEKLDLPERSHEDIVREIREFRETKSTTPP